jgi:hypothetical protein
MSFLINATYDGSSFQPDEPPPLRPNTRVVLSVESTEPDPREESAENVSFFDVALGMDLAGPPDWSARIDHYLYGIDDGK